MSITFDQNYFYSLCYQTGGFFGWHLTLKSTCGQIPQISLSKSSISQWYIQQRNSHYVIKYGGQDKYQGWYLSTGIDPKDKNGGLLYLVRNFDQGCLWVFEQIQGFCDDYAKRVIRNYKTDFYLRMSGNRRYLVTKEQFLTIIHKNLRDNGAICCWRIQKTQLNKQYQSKVSGIQDEISQLQEKVTKKQDQKDQIITKISKRTTQFQQIKRQDNNQIERKQNQIRKFVDRNAFLQAQLMQQQRWKASANKKQQQLIDSQKAFVLQRQQLQMDKSNFQMLKRQAQQSFQQKIQELQIFKKKVQALMNFDGRSVTIKMVWQEFMQKTFYIDEEVEKFQKSKNILTRMNKQHQALIQRLTQMVEVFEEPINVRTQLEDAIQVNNNLKFLAGQIQQEKLKFEQQYRNLCEQHFKSTQNDRKEFQKLKQSLLVLQQQNLQIEKDIQKQQLKYQYFLRLYEQQKQSSQKPKPSESAQQSVQQQSIRLQSRSSQLITLLSSQHNIQINPQQYLQQMKQNQPFQLPEQEFDNKQDHQGDQVFDIKKIVHNKMIGIKYERMGDDDDEDNQFQRFYSYLKRKRNYSQRNQQRQEQYNQQQPQQDKSQNFNTLFSFLRANQNQLLSLMPPTQQ